MFIFTVKFIIKLLVSISFGTIVPSISLSCTHYLSKVFCYHGSMYSWFFAWALFVSLYKTLTNRFYIILELEEKIDVAQIISQLPIFCLSYSSQERIHFTYNDETHFCLQQINFACVTNYAQR